MSAAARAAHPAIHLPVPILLALAAALLIAGQPLAAGIVPSSGMGDRSGMGGGLDAVSSGPPSAASASPPEAATIGRGVIDDQATVVDLSGYRWPLEHARITQAFGPASDGLFVVDGARFHDGLDLANFCGARILAAHDGVVIGAGRHVLDVSGWAGDVAAYGARLDTKQLWGTLALTVVIDDGNGYRSLYVHFHRVDVIVGQVVHAGDVIGLEGSTGHATGCHLHYSLYSPRATSLFDTNPSEVTRSYLPAAEIARIDPLSVMPPLEAGWITWGWGARDGS
ncbi:MAG TPA: M23 family metallopeptidase [Candidatus Limnocylindrales bacterium]|nr:M23 family metallopeptidase [Candidatus Limnocylindrales bacterium]